MSVFLTPDGRPFYGGTYFPPTRRFNMPAFSEILLSLADKWANDRESLLDIGNELRIGSRPRLRFSQAIAIWTSNDSIG